MSDKYTTCGEEWERVGDEIIIDLGDDYVVMDKDCLCVMLGELLRKETETRER